MPDRNAHDLSPEREAELLAVTVGERKELNAPILLAEASEDWPRQYAALRAAILRALGDRVLGLEHVGSTSVPHLKAKPILDMVLTVAASADEGSYVPALEGLGYMLRIREPQWHEHRMLRHATPAVNLHVFSAGCPEVARMLAFRDHLRANEQDRLLYEQEKVRLAALPWKYVQGYADAKSEVIGAILGRALAERPRP